MVKEGEGNGWWNSFIKKTTTGSSPGRERAGQHLKRESEAEIGEGLWVTGKLWLPLASERSSLSSGSAVERLHYKPEPEHVGASEADALRSVSPGSETFIKGIGDDNDADDGCCTDTYITTSQHHLSPDVAGERYGQWPVTKMDINFIQCKSVYRQKDVLYLFSHTHTIMQRFIQVWY